MAPKRKAEDDQQREKKKARPSNSEDLFFMSRQVKQANVDEFRRNVQRCSHIALERMNGFYFHHMLVTEVSESAIKVIEYSLTDSMPDIIKAVLAKYWADIHEKQIQIDTLFQPGASSVFLVYCDAYPTTDEAKNSAIQRAKSRLGENSYGLTSNNCEHFVRWALTGTPISIQWRDASCGCRVVADFFASLTSEVCNNVKLVLPKVVKDNFDISSIPEIDLLFTTISSLIQGISSFIRGSNASAIFWQLAKTAVSQILYSTFGCTRQIGEIFESLLLWYNSHISSLDLRRHIFKFAVSMLPRRTWLHAFLPFYKAILAGSLITVALSIAAGFVFDSRHSIANLISLLRSGEQTDI